MDRVRLRPGHILLATHNNLCNFLRAHEGGETQSEAAARERHELELHGRLPAGLPLRLEEYPHHQQPSLGRPVPESLTIADLKRAGSLLKIAALATLAGIPAQTLHSKIRRSGGLTPEESAALHNALAGVNLAVAK